MRNKIPKEFNEAKEYVKGHESELRNKYKDNYISVLGKTGIIDYDKDKFSLVKRIKEKSHLELMFWYH